MTLTLHEHPFAAYCWKALIALYERDVDAELAQVDGDAGRARLARLWPMSSIPVLVDDASGQVVTQSSAVVEYLDRFGDAAPLVPADRDAALRARMWDRQIDDYVHTPMQTIVLDNLRPEGASDAYGIAEARNALDRIYPVLDERLRDGGWLAGPGFTLADCAAAPALFYGRLVQPWDERSLAGLTGYYRRLTGRPSVDRVIEEARPFRELLPLPWPDHVE